MTSFTHNARKTFGNLFKSCWKPSTSESTAGPQSTTPSVPSSKIAPSNHDAAANLETNNQGLASSDLPSSAHANDAPSSTRPQRSVPNRLELGAAHSYAVLDRPEIDATSSDVPLHTGGTNDSAPIRTPELSIQQTQDELSDKTPESRPLPPLAPIDPTSVHRPQPTTHTPASILDETTLPDISRQSTLDLNTPAATPDTARSLEAHPRGPRSRAVLIGIHYTKHKNTDDWEPLDTPIRDVRKMHNLLLKHGYTEIRVLVDEFVHGYQASTVELPTKKTILDAFRWLIKGSRAGDRLFVHYCGHGHQIPTESLGESDGHDEAILPLAVQGRDSFIIDNELHSILVRPLPPGCHLMAVFDCCHSGTLLDLPWNHSMKGTTHRTSPPAITFDDPLPRSSSPRRMDTMEKGRELSQRRPRRSSTQKSAVKNPLNLPYIVLPDEAPNPGPRAPTEMQPPGLLHASKKRIDLQRVVLENTVISLERRRSSSSTTVMRPSGMNSGLGERPHSEIFIPRSLSPVPSRKSTLDTVKENALLPSSPRGSFAHQMVESPVSAGYHNVPKAPQVIAIAACQDQENSFENTAGGLLTNTFIEFMMQQNYQRASLAEVIDFLWKKFIQKTEEMHQNCAPCPGNCGEPEDCGKPVPDGHCVDHLCVIPLAPPIPLVTTLNVLSRDEPLLEGLF